MCSVKVKTPRLASISIFLGIRRGRLLEMVRPITRFNQRDQTALHNRNIAQEPKDKILQFLTYVNEKYKPDK